MTKDAAHTWYALDLTCEPSAREAAEYALTEAGALGTESATRAGQDGRPVDDPLVVVTGYFDAPPDAGRVRACVLEALRVYGLPPACVREEVRRREVADEDWLAEWKKGWQPVEAGRRFIVAPPWSEVAEGGGRIVLRIEPGMAFGTGTHETTRLCLAAIEKHFRGGGFLDVGTGTGILAIAAAKLDERARVEACDTDPLAVTVAHQNALLNGVAERINFRVGTVDDETPSADLVCANLTADVIVRLLPALTAATCGRLILSGVLDAQTDLVASRLSELSVERFDLTRDGEWVAIVI